MTRFLACGVVAVCAIGVIGLDAQQPVYRGRGDAVRVFVTVTDRDGRLVPSLTRDSFEVRDDGKPQPVVQFDASPRPIRLIVMLDVSGSMAGNLPLLRDASQQLFARLGPDDKARVGSFGVDVTISPEFTHDAAELSASLPDMIPPDAPTPLWRAVNEAMSAFGDEPDQRRVILVFTDGKDSGPIDFRHRAYSQADVIDRARNEDVMIYAVGMRSRPQQRPMQRGPITPGAMPSMLMEDLPDPGLARVAEEAGGGYLELRAGEDLAAAFTRVADELHSQYLLGYAAPKRDGKVHRIDVRVAGKGMKARGRRSYVAPKENP